MASLISSTAISAKPASLASCSLPRCSLQGFGRRAWCAHAFVCAPGRIVLIAAVGVDLPGDRRGRSFQAPSDGAQRLIAADLKEDLFTVANRETSVAWFPAERMSVPVLAGTDHETDDRAVKPISLALSVRRQSCPLRRNASSYCSVLRCPWCPCILFLRDCCRSFHRIPFADRWNSRSRLPAAARGSPSRGPSTAGAPRW